MHKLYKSNKHNNELLFSDKQCQRENKSQTILQFKSLTVLHNQKQLSIKCHKILHRLSTFIMRIYH